MRLLILILASILPIIAISQKAEAKAPVDQIQIFGTVIDSTTGEPVLEVTVEQYDLDGKRWSLTVSNSEGKYALFVPANTVFELRVVKENGYKPFFLKVDPRLGSELHQDLYLEPK